MPVKPKSYTPKAMRTVKPMQIVVYAKAQLYHVTGYKSAALKRAVFLAASAQSAERAFRELFGRNSRPIASPIVYGADVIATVEEIDS